MMATQHWRPASSRAGSTCRLGGKMTDDPFVSRSQSSASSTAAQSVPDTIAAGSLTDWDTLVARWEGRLHRYFRHLPCTSDQRRELVRNVLARVYEAARTALVGEDIASLIRAVARAEAAACERVLRHEVLMADVTEASHGAVMRSASATDRERLWEWLLPLLARFPEPQRVAIERGLDDVADAEIASQIKCEVGTVRVLRHRGIRELRRLARNCPPPRRGDLMADRQSGIRQCA